MKPIYSSLLATFLFIVFLPLLSGQEQKICEGETAHFRLNGYKTGEIVWQKSRDLETWEDISGANEILFEVTVTDSLFYRAKVSEGTCKPYYSDTTEIIMLALPEANFSSEYETVKPGNTVQFLNKSSGSPTIWSWNFQNGETSSEENPSQTYFSEGTFTVELTVSNECGADTEIKTNYISVSNDIQPAKTLYYAEKGGNIMAKKLVGDDVDPALSQPFDLGYSSGKHPLSLQFSGDWLYVFDAGTETGFTNDYETTGDGEIFVVAHDGSSRESVIENFGGNTFLDFYYGFIDDEEGMIYWADRREGIFRIPIDTRNEKFSLSQFEYFVRNNQLGYYGRVIAWGAPNGPICKIGDTFWWAKHTHASGVLKFVEQDINRDEVPLEEPGAGAIMTSNKVRGMAVDEINRHVYIAEQSLKMILKFDMYGELLAAIDSPQTDDGEGEEGGSPESLFVTGMALEQDENGDGYLYWAYRNTLGEEPASGIKRFKLNDPNAAAEYYIEDVQAYGIAIDNQLR